MNHPHQTITLIFTQAGFPRKGSLGAQAWAKRCVNFDLSPFDVLRRFGDSGHLQAAIERAKAEAQTDLS